MANPFDFKILHSIEFDVLYQQWYRLAIKMNRYIYDIKIEKEVETAGDELDLRERKKDLSNPSFIV